MIIQVWNAFKALWSGFAFMASPGLFNRQRLPQFTSPNEVADHIRRHFIYTGDPLGGAVDFYTHPEVMEAAFRQGPSAVKRLALDCDDLACYAWLALKGIPDCQPILYTLHDASGKFGHHVVCAYVYKGERGVIDTNGIRKMAAVTSPAICEEFTRVYARLGYRYTEAVPTPYPF